MRGSKEAAEGSPHSSWDSWVASCNQLPTSFAEAWLDGEAASAAAASGDLSGGGRDVTGQSARGEDGIQDEVGLWKNHTRAPASTSCSGPFPSSSPFAFVADWLLPYQCSLPAACGPNSNAQMHSFLKRYSWDFFPRPF